MMAEVKNRSWEILNTENIKDYPNKLESNISIFSIGHHVGLPSDAH